LELQSVLVVLVALAMVLQLMGRMVQVLYFHPLQQ
jgi:hypothetical protein